MIKFTINTYNDLAHFNYFELFTFLVVYNQSNIQMLLMDFGLCSILHLNQKKKKNHKIL